MSRERGGAFGDTVLGLLVVAIVVILVFYGFWIYDAVNTGRPSIEEARYVVYSENDKYYMDNYVVDENGNFIESGYWNRGSSPFEEWKYYEESLEISGNYTVRDRRR